jgi:HAD superfamily hydrolase (TIGR01509 family)
MTYKAALIDIDGTLVDSNNAHARAWMAALAERGRRVDFERVRPLIGMGADKLIPALIGLPGDSPQGKAIAERRREIFERDFIPTVRPTPGAAQLLEWLHDDELTVVAATSADPGEVRDLLRIAGATKLIDDAASSGDARGSKPDPDVVHAALKKAGCLPEEAILIGDTPYDVEAGHRAGVGVIALRCGGWWSDEALDGALAIYDSPWDLIDHYLLSPFKRPPLPAPSV